MTELNSQQLLDEYVIIHGNLPTYGAGNTAYLSDINQFIQDYGPTSILDFGCGKGGLVDWLRKIHPEVEAVGYDPCVEGFQSLPDRKFDMVISTDVFEHFHPHLVVQELEKVASLALQFCYFTVSTRPAKQVLPTTGEQCHTTLCPPLWWHRAIEVAFPEFAMLREDNHNRVDSVFKLVNNSYVEATR
mgnify:CR=1 FL=1